MNLLSQKQLCMGGWLADRTISVKTMRRERKRWGLRPVDKDGNQPLFDPEDVKRAQSLRLQVVLAEYV